MGLLKVNEYELSRQCINTLLHLCVTLLLLIYWGDTSHPTWFWHIWLINRLTTSKPSNGTAANNSDSVVNQMLPLGIAHANWIWQGFLLTSLSWHKCVTCWGIQKTMHMAVTLKQVELLSNYHPHYSSGNNSSLNDSRETADALHI